MENRAHALAAGVFVLLLGIATTLALWWFSGEREAMRELILVSTNNVSGLNVQAKVRYRGMSAGKVTAIGIDPEDVRNLLVTVRIHADLPITHGTTASFGTQGVTGLAYINLEESGADPRPLLSEDGKPPRIMLEPSIFDRLGDLVSDAFRRYQKIARQIDNFFTSDFFDRVGQTLGRIESAAGRVDETFQQAPKLINEIKKTFSAKNRAHIQNLLDNIDTASAQAEPLIGELRGTLEKLESSFAKLGASGERIFDTTLPHINELLHELNNTAVRMGRLVEEVEAHPQMLLSGRGVQQPGPGEQVPPEN